MSNKKLTWRQVKTALSELPEELLDKQVFAWKLEDEGGYSFVELLKLDDDYVFDGDSGCIPKKALIESDPENYSDENNEVIHPKGTLILIYE